MLGDLELQYLKLLQNVRTEIRIDSHVLDERLQDFVLECRERGSSARVMAEQLGVSPTSIQHWTELGRRRRE